jgi:NAD(P)-dependent dehydrogenase (short-subunit alcohol dehydrogenase family)
VIEVNTIGALAATQAFVPLLGTDRSRTGAPGRIINISSVAGRMSAPFLGAYAASKRGLEGMSESLRRELMIFGIDVIVINPGAIATPIWDKAEVQGGDRYEQTEYASLLQRFLKCALSTGRSGLPAEGVGEVVWEALTTRRPRTFYPIMRNRLTAWTIPLALPARFLDRLIARRLGIGRP